jgi:hypothetical protein
MFLRFNLAFAQLRRTAREASTPNGKLPIGF